MEIRKRNKNNNKINDEQEIKCQEFEEKMHEKDSVEENKSINKQNNKKSSKCNDVKQIDLNMESYLTQLSTRIKINFEIDIITILLFWVSVITRFYRLEEPKNVVFDELHYGKYVSLYMKQTFFFDSHPPFGKQLISAAAYLAGFDGNFKFEKIGSSYAENIPLFALRLVPALCGSLVVPTAYHFALELGLRQWSSIIASLLLLFDNALLTQSRFILMESILIQFSLMGLLCILKFRKVIDNLYSFAWWFWLATGLLNITCAICTKYVGIYNLFVAIFIIGRDYWSLIPKKRYSISFLYTHLFARIFAVITVVSAVYLGVFYLHLSVLSKAGPHDAVMTSAFQASLEGGLASITKGQPLEVTHGSQITLRHTHGRACWLHSHDHVYPLRYPDGRGSSHQQQVTCYSFKDVNNWWIVKRPEINDLVVTKPSKPIKDGDVIQLVHGITSRALNSHDVAAPMTPQSQEISCYIDYNISMPAQNLWKVQLINKDLTDNAWHAIQSQIRLIHVNSEFALKFTGRQLPDWGFNQHEVASDRLVDQSDSVWNVEEHRYTKSEDQKQRERELINAEMIPLKATSLSFWQKFIELQIKMLFNSQEAQNTHMYASSPFEWPFMTRGIAYWVSSESNAQVHLLGNVAVWYSGTLFLVVYLGLLVVYLMRRQRLCYDIDEQEWEHFKNIGEVLLVGYLINFLPFFFVERTLFLHHYLPAFVFKVFLMAATVEHVYYLVRFHCKWKVMQFLYQLFIIIWISLIIYVFKKFCALSYGVTPLSAKEVLKLRWSDEWDFIIHKS